MSLSCKILGWKNPKYNYIKHGIYIIDLDYYIPNISHILRLPKRYIIELNIYVKNRYDRRYIYIYKNYIQYSSIICGYIKNRKGSNSLEYVLYQSVPTPKNLAKVIKCNL